LERKEKRRGKASKQGIKQKKTSTKVLENREEQVRKTNKPSAKFREALLFPHLTSHNLNIQFSQMGNFLLTARFHLCSLTFPVATIRCFFFLNFLVEAGARVASIPTRIQTDFARLPTVFEQTVKTAASRHNCRHTLPKKNNLQLLIGDFK
jgi:hypothetical protein